MVERYTHRIPDHKVAAIQKLRDNVPDIFTAPAEGDSERELQARDPAAVSPSGGKKVLRWRSSTVEQLICNQ